MHQRHHSASSSRLLNPFSRNDSADRLLEQSSNTASQMSLYGRRRPGSESDVLDVKASEVSLHHQDSLMLAYHQRPSVVAGHSSSIINSNTPIRQVKPVSVWTQSEVCKWLKKHLPESQIHYVDLFLHHDITGKTLLMLNEAKLLRIGVNESAHRTVILNEILKLQMKNYMQYFKGLQTAGMFDTQ